MTGGLDEKRALEHIKNIREVDRQMEGRIRVFTGIEVDILADGALDLDDEVLAQMDVVIASVHTRFEQSREEMTERGCSGPSRIRMCAFWGIPPGACCCAANRLRWIWARSCAAVPNWACAVEHNAAPERLDLNDRDLRLAKESGLQDRDQHRRPRRQERGEDGIRHPPASPRMAWAGGCAEHAGARSFAGRAAGRSIVTRWNLICTGFSADSRY